MTERSPGTSAHFGLACSLWACVLLGCGADPEKPGPPNDMAIEDSGTLASSDATPRAEQSHDANSRDATRAEQSDDGGTHTDSASPRADAAATSSDASTTEATLDSPTLKACQLYCQSDADCCSELGLGAACPDRFPDRALCHIEPARGWDHVCRALRSACLDDQECRAKDSDLFCSHEARPWCSDTLCPGLGACLDPGCTRDEECAGNAVCIAMGGVGFCMRPCSGTNTSECEPLEMCQGNLVSNDPRSFCIGQSNVFPPQAPRECATDADCASSGNGPRCHKRVGYCGCGADGDCAADERCREPRG